MAGADEAADRRLHEVLAAEAMAELRRLFQPAAPDADPAGGDLAEELVVAGAAFVRQGLPAFEPFDAVDAMWWRSRLAPVQPAFSLDGMAPPTLAPPPVPVAALAPLPFGRPGAAVGKGVLDIDDAAPETQDSWTLETLAAYAEVLEVNEEELLAYLLAIGPNAAILRQLQIFVLSVDRATAKAMFALFAAIATLVREFSDGELHEALSRSGARGLIAALARRGSDGRTRFEL